MLTTVNPVASRWPALVYALAGALFVTAGYGQTKAVVISNAEIRHIGSVAHPPVDEMSGIVKSRMFENLWWVHNDHGNAARVFGINREGEVVMPPWQSGDYFVGEPESDQSPWPGVRLGVAINIDWEDIALKDGRLYIGDVGNNGNARRDLGIYIVREPNARATDETRTFKHIPIAYPDQAHFPASPAWRYDCEAIFFIDGKLHLLTKHRRDQQINGLTTGTKLYRLETMKSERVNTLTRVDTHRTIPPPTAGALSPNGQTLAVLTTHDLWLFPRPDEHKQWLSGPARRIRLPGRIKAAEGVCWDNDHTLRINTEQRSIFTITLPKRSGD